MKKEKNIQKNENTKSDKKKDNSGVSFLILKIVIAMILLLVVVYFGFTCEVRESNAAIILRFGAPRAEITEAGLYFKLPWPFETVVTYDKRVQYLESNNHETTTMDKKNIILQSYATWEIKNSLTYHNSVGAKGTVDSYIKDQIKNATNSVMGTYNLSDLISSQNENIKTDEIQQKIFELVKNNCETNYGISVVDVSILRISYPDANLQAVFANISAERQGVIDKILADADAKVSDITSSADAEAEKIKGEGITQAAEIRAQAEKEVASIYANAQSANIELYKFLKELDTIVNSVNEGTVLVVDSESYPFNILLDYGNKVDNSSDDKVIEDLTYIVATLRAEGKDQEAEDLVAAINAILAAYVKGDN
jgi:membrane protease subunit HflC